MLYLIFMAVCLKKNFLNEILLIKHKVFNDTEASIYSSINVYN